MVIVSAVDGPDDQHVVEESASLSGAFDEDLHVLHVASREDIENPESGGSETMLERAERHTVGAGTKS